MKAMLFGKLPAHGDFVSRGLGVAERDALDAWLAASLQEAREALGDRFEARYDAAPAWRFIEPDGEALTAGALAPSVDAAGRRYPVYLAMAGVEADTAPAAAEVCEDLLYDAFGQGWDADQLHAAAERAVLSVKAEGEAAPRWWTLGGEDFAPAGIPGPRPAMLLREVLAADETRA